MELRTDLIEPEEITATVEGEILAAEQNDITAQLLPRETVRTTKVEFELGGTVNYEGDPLRVSDAESGIGGSRRGEKRFAECVAASWKVRINEDEVIAIENSSEAEEVLHETRAPRTEVREVIIGRLRRLRSEALLTGRLAINERGVVQNVDFGRRPDFTAQTANPWNDPTADPIADIENFVAAFADENEVEPEVGVIGRAAASAMLSNPNVIARFPQGVEVTLERVNNLLDERGYTTLRINRNRRVLSQNHLLFAIPGIDRLGSTVWGPTAEARLEEYGLDGDAQSVLAMGVYGTVDPVALWVHGAARYLPVLKNANLSLSAQVL